MARIILKKNRETSVKRRHPWIFSGGIYKIEGAPAPGELIEVWSANDEILGVGFYQDSSISVRLLNFGTSELPEDFWKRRVSEAWRLRNSMGLPDIDTNIFRLIHGEGDGLPGLIIDVYGSTAVIQFHELGMYLSRKEIIDALTNLPGTPINSIYNKSSETLQNKKTKLTDGFLHGDPSSNSIYTENGHQFIIDLEKGQKTGFFIDQRDNRQLLGKYSKGKKVLNAFSYTGGFSVYALAHGAKSVVSMDISGSALEQADQNVGLLGKSTMKRHRSVKADVVKHLRQDEEQYDIIVLDPPAFAKRMSARHNAVQAYKRINATALAKLPKGGMLFTFSCSQVVTRTLFEDTILAAALEVGRPVRILHRLSQAPDHPVNIFHPESEYLKGLVLEVE